MEGEPAKKKRKVEEGGGIDIEKLPEEVFVEILSYVQPKFPALLRLQEVSKYWRSVISKPSALWGGLLYFNAASGNKISTEVIIRYLSRCPENALTSFYLGLFGTAEGVAKPDLVENSEGSKVLTGTGFQAGEVQLRHFIDMLADRATNLTSLLLEVPFFAVPKSSAIRLGQSCLNLKELLLVATYGDEERSETEPPKKAEGECATFMDVVENLPSSLSNVSLTISHGPQCNHYPIMFPSEAGKVRRVCKCVTRLCIPDDEMDSEFLRLLCPYLPSLDAVEVHTYWGGTDLSCFPAKLTTLGFGERDMHCCDSLIEVKNNWPNLKALKLYGGIPNFTDLAALTSLEYLEIESDCNREDEGPEEIDAMWNALTNLKEVFVPRGLFGDNLSKYILTSCSPSLEKIVLSELVDAKHVAHLLDGTFENDEDEDEENEEKDEEEEEEDKDEEDEEEEEEHEDWGEVDKERNKRAKELQKKLAERKKTEKQQKERKGRMGLKWIEIEFERDEHCFDPASDVFDETEWNAFYEAALQLVEERHPAVRLVHVVPRVRIVFVKND